MSYMTIDAVMEDGDHVEILIDRKDCPQMGEWFEYEDQWMVRVPSRPKVRVKRYEFKGWSLPFRDSIKGTGLTEAPHYDDDGVPVFTTRKEMQEYAAKVNDNPAEGVQLQWDPDGNE